MASMAWGRATTGGGPAVGAGTPGKLKLNGIDVEKVDELKLVNVVATGSVDQTVKIWTP